MKKTLLALSFLLAIGAGAAQDRPNILWLTSEDNSYHWIGCYGGELARTPNIDRLASRGIRYEYAYANAPVCAVARFSLITGRYACSMGTQNMRSRYPIPSRFRTYVSYLREAGYYCTNNSKTDYNFATKDAGHWDESSGQAHWKNRPADKPFFAIFNTTTSHESCLFPKKTASFRQKGLIPAEPSRDPASVTLPPFLPDTPEIREDWATYLDVITAMDGQIGARLQELEEAGLADDTIVFYYGDHGGVLPRSKRYVYDSGTHVPMIVHLPEKWAHLATDPSGSVSRRPVSFIDLPPTLLSLAGVPVPEAMQGRAFLGQGAREAEPYVFLFGQRFDSRMLRFVRAVTNGRYRYIRNFHPHRHRGILTGYPHGHKGWQSFYALHQAGKTAGPQASFWKRPQPVEELYDTQADPWEVTNLADDPASRERLRTMRSAVLDTMREIRDTGLVPESMYPGISAESTVFDYVQDPAFPYDRVLELALAAGDGSATLKRLHQSMTDEHPVIRYWGALGCTIRGEGTEATRSRLAALLLDPVPGVRVAAAEALIVVGDPEEGVAGLVSVLEETNDAVVTLEALNIARALNVTRRIPREVYDRACRTGAYAKDLADEYPN